MAFLRSGQFRSCMTWIKPGKTDEWAVWLHQAKMAPDESGCRWEDGWGKDLGCGCGDSRGLGGSQGGWSTMGRKKRLNSQRWLVTKRDKTCISGTRLTEIAMIKRGNRMGKGSSNLSLTSYSLPSKNGSQTRKVNSLRCAIKFVDLQIIICFARLLTSLILEL